MRVEVYSKPECLLCEEAKDALRRVQARVPFTWTETDVTHDLVLRARHRYDLPVILVNGEVAFCHHVDEAALERLLREGA